MPANRELLLTVTLSLNSFASRDIRAMPARCWITLLPWPSPDIARQEKAAVELAVSLARSSEPLQFLEQFPASPVQLALRHAADAAVHAGGRWQGALPETLPCPAFDLVCKRSASWRPARMTPCASRFRASA